MPPVAATARAMGVHCLCAMLVWGVVSLAAPSVSATRVAVAVPDIAGTLYPLAATHRTETFGNSDKAFVEPFYATELNASDPVSHCEYGLCLDVVWSSVFASDPFVLRAFESTYDVHSQTFDGISTQFRASTTSPIIAGDAAAFTATAGSTTSDAVGTTRWRFNTPQASAGLKTIRLTFRLSQQSQRDAVKDQITVHVAATRRDDHSGDVAIDSFVVYGNARLEHRSTSLAGNHARVDFAIVRNASSPDVAARDAYPLQRRPPTDQERMLWTMPDSGCLFNTAELLGCKYESYVNTGRCSFDQSSASFIRCLRESQAMRTGWFREMAMKSSLMTTISIRNSTASCLDALVLLQLNTSTEVRETEWWWTARALSYLVRQRCPFGPKNGVVASDQGKFIQIEGDTELAYTLQLHDTTEFSGQIALEFGSFVPPVEAVVLTTDELNDATTAAEIETQIQSLIAPLVTPRVSVSKAFDSVTTTWTIDVAITDLVFPSLSLAFIPRDGVRTAFSRTHVSSGPVLRVAPLSNYQGVAAVDPCSSCSAELLPCGMNASCQERVLSCVGDVLEGVSAANTSIDEVYGVYRVDLLAEMRLRCFANGSFDGWGSVLRALKCVSHHGCDLSGRNTTSSYEATTFRLTNGSQLIAIPRFIDDNNQSRVALTISAMGKEHTFNQSLDELPAFLETAVLPSGFTVLIETDDSDTHADMVQLWLLYPDSLFPNPSFDGTIGLETLKDIAPAGFLEFADRATFSVAKLLNAVRELLVQDTTPNVNSTWTLAADCETCSAELYGCSVATVRNNSCNYDNAPSRFATCIRNQLPREQFVQLLARSPGESSYIVSPLIAQCVAQAGNSAESHGALRAMACYANTGCPFGPLHLVTSTRMPQLVTSSFVHRLRIRAATFQLHVLISTDSLVLAVGTINSASWSEDFSTMLSQLGITLRHRSDFHRSPPEWTLSLEYRGVTTPRFTVTIRPYSSPPGLLIEQSFIRSTARLIAAPRNPEKVFINEPVTPIPWNSSSSGSWGYGSGSWGYGSGSWGYGSGSWGYGSGSWGYGSGSWGSGSGSWNYSFGAIGDMDAHVWLSSAEACLQCDAIHLTNCGRSKYCHTLASGCLLDTLNGNTFEELAMQTTNGTTVVDFTNILHTCINDSSGNATYYDWWEPLQRFLACYAINNCSITDADAVGSGGRGVFVYSPASVQVLTEMEDLDEVASALVVIPPTGSSLTERETSVASLDELTALLRHLTQGIANVSSEHSAGILTFRYSEPFLGSLPTFRVKNTSAQSSIDVFTANAQLVLRTTHDAQNPGWELLTDKLSATFAPSRSTMSECADAFMAECAKTANCSGYMLDCVQFSVENHSVPIFSTDRDLYQVLLGCSRELTTESWRYLQRFLVCVRDAQAPISGTDDSPASQLRIQSGGIRVFVRDLWANLAYMLLAPFGSLSDDTWSSYSSIRQIRDVLQKFVGSGAKVEMKVSGTVNAAVVEYIFHNFVGRLPTIYTKDARVEAWDPMLVAYSSGANTSSTVGLTSTLAAFVRYKDCAGSCRQHLDECLRGDTHASLICRQTLLPRLHQALIENSPILTAHGWKVAQHSWRFDLSALINTLTAGLASNQWEAVRPLFRYLLCFSRSNCALNRPSSQFARASLVVQAGWQLLEFPSGTSAITVMNSAGDAMNLPVTDLTLAKWMLEITALKGQGTVTFSPGKPKTTDMENINIYYDDYIGQLPSILSSHQLFGTRPPSVVISTDDATGFDFSILQAPVQNAYESLMGLTGNCSACWSHISSLTEAQEAIVFCVGRKLAIMQNQLLPSFDLSVCLKRSDDVSNWMPIFQLLQCLMAAMCDTTTGDHSHDEGAAFLAVVPSVATIIASAQMYIFDQVRLSSPPSPPGGSPSATYAPVEFSRLDNYAGLVDALNRSLTLGNQTPLFEVREIRLLTEDITPSHVKLSVVLELAIYDFIGWLPYLNDMPISYPSVSLLTIDDTRPVSGSGFVSSLASRAWGSSPLTLVGRCARYGADLFGCTESAVLNGSCSYETADTLFMTCLRGYFPASYFVDRTRGTWDGEVGQYISDHLDECVRQVSSHDAGSPTASFRQDLWYQAYEALVGFVGCPLGPLEVLRQSFIMFTMFVVANWQGVWTIRIHATQFEAFFRASFGSRVLETTAFNETTPATEITAILYQVMPASSRLDVQIEPPDPDFVCTVRWYGFLKSSAQLDVVASNGTEATSSYASLLSGAFLMSGDVGASRVTKRLWGQ